MTRSLNGCAILGESMVTKVSHCQSKVEAIRENSLEFEKYNNNICSFKQTSIKLFCF
jgi:hypothetical protein